MPSCGKQCIIRNHWQPDCRMETALPWYQDSWGQHGAHLWTTGPRWAPCWPHELCYLGNFFVCTSLADGLTLRCIDINKCSADQDLVKYIHIYRHRNILFRNRYYRSWIEPLIMPKDLAYILPNWSHPINTPIGCQTITCGTFTVFIAFVCMLITLSIIDVNLEVYIPYMANNTSYG